MSTKSGGSFATILLALPLTAIALMGIFGVPEFASVIASPDRAELLRRPFRGDGYNDRESDPYYDSGRPHADDAGFDQRHDAYANDAPAFGAENSSASPRYDEQGRRYPDERPSQRYAESSAESQFANASSSNRSNATRNGATHRGNPFMETTSTESRAADSGMYRTADVNNRSSMAGPASNGLDWRSAARKLADMGIDRYHLERGSTPDSFLFVCLVTPSDNSNVTHRFESENSDPLAAVGHVLQQVDGWLQQRFAQRSLSGQR